MLLGRAKEAFVGAASAVVVVLIAQSWGAGSLENAERLASVSIAVMTIPLVALSYVLYRETRATRLENSEPRVVVTIEPGRYFTFFDLVVENIGKGAALDVHTKLDPDITVSDQARPTAYSLSQAAFLNPPMLKPGQRIAQYLGRIEEISPHRVSVECTSVGDDGRTHVHRSTIDLGIYEGMSQLGPDDYVGEVAKHMESLSKSFAKVVSNSRFQVDAHGEAERQRAQDRRTRERQEFRRQHEQPSDGRGD